MSARLRGIGLAIAVAWYMGYPLPWKWMMLFTGASGALLLFTLYSRQEAMLYQPRAFPQHIRPSENPVMLRSPSEWNLPYEEVELVASDGVKLAGWLIKQVNSAECKTLVYFQGNAGNMGMRLHNLVELYRKLGVNIFVLSYRGYGDSEGEPSESGFCLDAEASLNFLQRHSEISSKNIVLFGRSLGGAVAIHLASTFPEEILATVVENSFTSISDLVDHLFPPIAPLKSRLLRLDWNSLARVPRITHKVLFISGAMDELVPASHMQRLAAATSGAELKVFPKGTHNETWRSQGYILALNEFLRTCE